MVFHFPSSQQGLSHGFKCIYCDICRPACPNNAISVGSDYYQIDPDLCTECIGHYDEPQCQQVCPVECISRLLENAEIQGHI
ncbi:YfhL family 4Fe-4S dicluster ferredoxin [Serratia sp. 2723]|uniref:YfhL family 4Fe-4S dicluster ferredoxin n=1 Tax=unclassified Serratia (in: enterobacteria) TaxID=2647522 RepID=UPI003D19B234